MDSSFCVDALQEALLVANPEIFNTDQGSQFTSQEFTGVLQENEIAISMDGKGRALDNVFIERLWWTVKYEDVYPKAYSDGIELYHGLTRYFRYYKKITLTACWLRIVWRKINFSAGNARYPLIHAPSPYFNPFPKLPKTTEF